MRNLLFHHPVCFRWGKRHNTDTKLIIRKPTVSICILQSPKGDHVCKNSAINIDCPVMEESYRIESTLLSTIADIKQKIETLVHIPAALQILYFDDVALPDINVLAECGITNETTLKLCIKLHTAKCSLCSDQKFCINTKPVMIRLSDASSKKYEIQMPLSNLVADLKCAMESKYGIPAQEQMLFFKFKKLDDDVALADYDIEEYSTINLSLFEYDSSQFCAGCVSAFKLPMISLLFGGNSVVWVLNPYISIRNFKWLTYKYLKHVHPDLQNVLHKNKELQDENTLKDYDISDGDVLRIMLRFDRRRCDVCNELLLNV